MLEHKLRRVFRQVWRIPVVYQQPPQVATQVRPDRFSLRPVKRGDHLGRGDLVGEQFPQRLQRQSLFKSENSDCPD